MEHIFQELQQRAGVHFMGQPDIALQAENVRVRVDHSTGGLACDAQPTLVTVSNAGIPAFLSTYIDPKLIDILVSPMKAAEIAGSERKVGDWVMKTSMFPIVESTGEVSSYGDYANSGQAGVNANYPQRQSYHYQVVTQWGEQELERAGLGRIDLANRLNIASVLTLNKFQNKTYFFGVANLQNYGLLNDPNLSAPISPTTKTAGGTGWANATAAEVLADVQKLYKQLQTQMNGLVDLESPMTLAMSPISQVAWTKTTDFNVNVADIIAKNFPNLTVKTAPEYTTTSGELIQLFLEEYEGQKTVECAFTEKLRAHPIKIDLSSFAQKKSQGTWGAIWYRPVACAQMLGV